MTGIVTSYTGIETVAGGPYTLNVATSNFGIVDGNPDTVRLVRNGAYLELYVDTACSKADTPTTLRVVVRRGGDQCHWFDGFRHAYRRQQRWLDYARDLLHGCSRQWP